MPLLTLAELPFLTAEALGQPTRPAVSLNRITHLHVSSTVTGCDGQIDRDYIWTPATMTGREAFTWWVQRALDRGWEWHTTLERGTQPDGLPYYDYFGHHEEGWRSEYVVGCDEDCDPRDRRHNAYRDHFAEAMGY